MLCVKKEGEKQSCNALIRFIIIEEERKGVSVYVYLKKKGFS